MNEEIDVGEIIRLAQTEFNLSFSFDVSRMQNLFGQLCINIQKLQNDLLNLKKDLQNKADKDQLEPLNNEITHNNDDIDDLKDKIEKLNGLCSEKIGIPKTSSDLQNKEENNNISRPLSSNRKDRSEEFDERITKCEDKLADFDKRFDEMSKILLSDLPNQNKGTTNKGPTRHERFEGFLEEFDVPTPRLKEEGSEKGSGREEKNDKEIEPEQEPESIPKSNSEQKPAHSDETLETFLDAAKIEIENAKKLLSDEFDQQMKENNIKLNSSISKAAADSEVGLKKANEKLNDTEIKLDNQIKEISTDNQQQFSQLRESLEALANKVKTLESRIESNAKASEMTKDSLKRLVTDDGKIDSQELLDQMEQHLTIINDLDGRLIALENREHVSPDSFNTTLKTLSEFTEKVKDLEIRTQSTDAEVSGLKETIESLKTQIDGFATHDQLNDVDKIIHDLQDDSSNLREAIIKNNKDIVNVRAAINTLRGNSEETRSISEDALNAAKHAAEDAQNNEKRLKKMVVLTKSETDQIFIQLKDLTNITERHDEAITEIQRTHEADIARLEAMKGGEEDEESYEDDSEEDGTARPKSSKKTKKVPTVSTATSPHLPSLSGGHDSTSADTNLQSSHLISHNQPKTAITASDTSQPSNQPSFNQQTIHDQQPIVTAVRKRPTTEITAASLTSNSSKRVNLPRLAQQTAKREVEGVRMDLKRYEDLIPRVERLESTVSALKSNYEPLSKSVKSLSEIKADRAELQGLFEQFRMALGELNNRVGGIRKTVASKADVTELKEIQRALIKELVQNGETAAGTEAVRCLLCGQPRTNVTGAIDDPTLAKAIGNAMSSRVCGADGQGNVCFVYGEHGEMFMGRSVDGRPIYSKMGDSENDGGSSSLINGPSNANGRGSSGVAVGGKPPMTAPMIARKILDVPPQNAQ